MYYYICICTCRYYAYWPCCRCIPVAGLSREFIIAMTSLHLHTECLQGALSKRPSICQTAFKLKLTVFTMSFSKRSAYYYLFSMKITWYTAFPDGFNSFPWKIFQTDVLSSAMRYDFRGATGIIVTYLPMTFDNSIFFLHRLLVQNGGWPLVFT